MTENIFTRVKHYMKSQSFSVDDSWLRECAEYFISSNPQANAEAVQKFVQEQYLLSDLQEINTLNGCLPANLAQQKTTILNGKYTLQLLKLYDISVSKFKQLEKIRNVSIDNIEATKEERTQNWEPTGKRMLQLFLTDGIQEVLAIEFKSIRVLNESLLPGLKLMIIGPVVCRRGVILLEETNICIKGGEVDVLLIPNALENVLARKLNMPLNEDPYNDTKVKKKETPVNVNELDDDFNIDLEEIEKIERSQEAIVNERPPSNQNSLPSTSNSNSHSNSRRDLNYNQSSTEVQRSNRKRIPENINEFPTDEDFDFEDIYVEEFAPPTKNRNQNAFKAPSEPISKPRNFDQPKPSTSSNFPQFPDYDFDLDDVDFELSEAWNEPLKLPINKSENNSETVSSLRNDSQLGKAVEVPTGSKRNAGTLSPLPTSNSKIRCAQSTPKISKVNRKITDFIDNNTAPPKEELPPKICDYICDVLTQSLTDQLIRKTVRGKVSQIGKLTKKNLLWILDGTILDDSGSIDVDFSSQFMENILGMSVSEFLQQKKKIKTDPKLEEQLRKQMLDGQNKLQKMDSLMELELKKDTKAVVISSREITQTQKNDYNKRFRLLKSKMA